MNIPQNATQEELEQILRSGINHAVRMVLLAGVLLSPFCYLRCLLNPLWVLGLKIPGIFVTALFGCYVGWQYVNGNPGAGETALLWWAVWAAIMFIIHYIFYALTPISLCRNSRKINSPIGDDMSGVTHPQELTIKLHKNPEGYLQATVQLCAPVTGLYALRWELCDYAGEFATVTDEGVSRAAFSEHSIENKNTLTEIYRLQAGTHNLCLRLADRDAARPSPVVLTQLNTPSTDAH